MNGRPVNLEIFDENCFRQLFHAWDIFDGLKENEKGFIYSKLAVASETGLDHDQCKQVFIDAVLAFSEHRVHHGL